MTSDCVGVGMVLSNVYKHLRISSGGAMSGLSMEHLSKSNPSLVNVVNIFTTSVKIQNKINFA